MFAVTIEAQGAVLMLRNVPKRAREAVVQAITREAISLANYIKAEKLSGQVLKNRTGNLRRATAARPTVVTDREITGEVSVDSTAWYGKIHEYGGRFTIPEHMRRTQSGGEAVVRAHEANFPERSFMRSALADKKDAIAASIRAAVKEALA